MARLTAVAPKGDDTQELSLIIEPDEDGEGVYLFRYAGTEFAGDTWHESVAQAQQQAEFENEAPLIWVDA